MFVEKPNIIAPKYSNAVKSYLWWKKNLPDWMTYAKTVLCQKEPAKRSAVDNYRAISCLPLLWKLMTGILPEKMHSHLERGNVLISEEKNTVNGVVEQTLHKKWSFLLRISSVNVTKSAVFSGFGHIYWRNP